MKKFAVVVAATAENMGIGRNGDLPWKLAGDMAYFKRKTSNVVNSTKMNAVIMGRKTWESIPEKFRPLSKRFNVILSKNPLIRKELNLPDTVLTAGSLDEALAALGTAEMSERIESIYVIGGGSVYSEAVKSNLCSKIYLTSIETVISDIDTFFPVIPAHKYRLTSRSAPVTEDSITYRFTEYDVIDDNLVLDAAGAAGVSSSIGAASSSESKLSSPSLSATAASPNLEEQQYLDLIRDIITNGVVRGDRTGTGTISKFGVQMRFSLRNDNFPLLTTKKVFWRGVAEELLWFVKGSTNAKELQDKDIHIWDGNGSREFLDSRGLSHREVGDLGPVYGFQWRHFGAEYKDMHSDYSGKGVDQLIDCINKLKSTPEDRRIIMSAWNPADLDKMALPPCHMFCQFYVANNELSCQMYQRSADMGLGVPFNIASYSLLTYMIAQVCGMRLGDFVHTIGDAHVYLNHVDALKEQLARTPKPFPKFKLNQNVKNIEEFKYEDFVVEGYNPDAVIKMKMAV